MQHLEAAALVPNPDNPRKITPKAIRHLVKSLEDFGWIQPLIVRPITDGENKGKYLIVDGHHRFQAAKFLPPALIPCVVLPVGLTAEQEFKLMFKVNRQYAEYDRDKVRDRFKQGFPDLVTVPMFDELGIDFLKPDFLAPPAPAEITQNAALDEKLMKYEKVKEAVETVLKETANQIDQSFVMFAHGKNRYLIVLVDSDAYLKLKTRQEADPLTFAEAVTAIISQTF